MRRRSLALVIAAVAALAPLGAHAQDEGAQDDGGGDGLALAGDTTTTAPPPATSLPPGCVVPDPAQAVFVGRLLERDLRTARYQVIQVRAGALGMYEVNGLVDVDYGDDVRYLERDEQYLVGAGLDGETFRLHSKVRAPAPMLGGSQVVGIDDSAASCPEIEDPVMTLHLDGSTVETGVLTPLSEERRGILRALALPVVWVLGALLLLAALKGVVFGAGRAARRLWRGEPVLATRPTPRVHRPEQ